MLESSEQEYYHANLHRVKGDQHRIYELCNNLLGRDKDLPLPPTTSPASLANEFNQFFIDKIQIIKQKILSNNTEDINPHFMDTKTDKLMTEFRECLAVKYGV